MKELLASLNDVDSEQLADFLFTMPLLKERRVRFTTSAEVVMKVSGLRFAAIRAIAREQGIRIDNPKRNNINEQLLSAFAEAHIRKLRAYFNNARRYAAELGKDELAAFADFCETFRKCQTDNVRTWNDIDVDAIRAQFIRNVKRITPGNRRRDSDLLSVFRRIYNLSDDVESDDDFFIDYVDGYKTQETRQLRIMAAVLASLCYNSGSLRHCHNIFDYREKIKVITRPAKFHIFIDEDDHHLISNCDDQYKLLTGALRVMARCYVPKSA